MCLVKINLQYNTTNCLNVLLTKHTRFMHESKVLCSAKEMIFLIDDSIKIKRFLLEKYLESLS